MRKRVMYILIATFAVWLFSSMLAAAQTPGFGQPTPATDVTVVLAPLLAAALGIERLLETLWGIVESVLNMLAIAPSGEKYLNFKTWASAVFGIVTGIIIASAAQLQMFGLLGLTVNARADILITGLVIGSGSKFTHDIIGILNEGKRSLQQWRMLTEHRRVTNSADKPQLKISVVDGGK